MPTGEPTAPTDALALLPALRRSRTTILTTVLAALAVGAAVTFVPPPLHRASAKLVIRQGADVLHNVATASVVETVTHTMADLFVSDVVARRAIRDAGLPLSSRSLRDRLSVSLKPSSAVLTVAYDDRRPARARLVLDAVTEAFATLVFERFSGPPADGAPRQPLSVLIFDPPHDEGRIRPVPVRNMAIAAAVGVAAGILLGVLRDTSRRPPRRRQAGPPEESPQLELW